MKNKSIDQEMAIDEYKKLLIRIKKSDKSIDTIKLLGGEPTLHTQFEKIIKISLKQFTFVQIFTNGIIEEKRKIFLEQFFPRVKLTFNVMTPGMMFNKKIHKEVISCIDIFSQRTEVTLSLTIDPHTNIDLILNAIEKRTWASVFGFRIGFSNPVAGEKNLSFIDQFS